jgi:hypothetical protein
MLMKYITGEKIFFWNVALCCQVEFPEHYAVLDSECQGTKFFQDVSEIVLKYTVSYLSAAVVKSSNPTSV